MPMSVDMVGLQTRAEPAVAGRNFSYGDSNNSPRRSEPMRPGSWAAAVRPSGGSGGRREDRVDAQDAAGVRVLRHVEVPVGALDRSPEPAAVGDAVVAIDQPAV